MSFPCWISCLQCTRVYIYESISWCVCDAERTDEWVTHEAWRMNNASESFQRSLAGGGFRGGGGEVDCVCVCGGD